MKNLSTRPVCFVSMLTASVLLHSNASLADTAPPPHATLTTSLLTPFFGAYTLEGNIRISQTFGVLVNASYVDLEKDTWRSQSGTLGVGLSRSLAAAGLRRWYIESWVEAWLSSWRHEPSGKVASPVVGYAGEALVGYRFIWNGPVLDLGAGVLAAYLPSATVTTNAGAVSSGARTMVYPAVKINVGWAF